jgi:D-alanyl-D-alanine carboxypeptidase (penicillin-binding protein 5/6)
MRIRNLLFIFQAAVLVFTAPCAHAASESDFSKLEMEAENVLLAGMTEEWKTEEILYELDSEELVYPGSTIKMLTALTVLGIAGPDENVRVGMEYFLTPSDASKAGLKPMMKLTIRDLLKGLLLPSGSDAAYTLAAYCGRKAGGGKDLSVSEAVACFVDMMNDKAASIGAGHTTAVNVDGYDEEGQLTTAQDLLVITEAFLKEPVLSEICALAEDEMTVKIGKIKKKIPVKNTNEMLHKDSIYYNSAVSGVKTGTTSLAGGCLVSAFDIQGEEYICIVMKSSHDGRYSDTQKLYDVTGRIYGGSDIYSKRIK